MQIDKSAIKRGMMMHGGPCPAAYVHDGSVVVSKSFDQPKATPSLKEIGRCWSRFGCGWRRCARNHDKR
jgi:hypothetical protein